MPPRMISFTQGHFYHIYNRGSACQPIFFEEENYLYLLRLVKKYALVTGITVIAYCLMPNHYHFLVRQDSDNPAGLLFQRVFNAYTKANNKKYNRSGTLFQGRYRCILLVKTSHLFQLCRYIHANPVKAGMVAYPENGFIPITGNGSGCARGHYVTWILSEQILVVPASMSNLFRSTWQIRNFSHMK
jgi:putative transposase